MPQIMIETSGGVRFLLSMESYSYACLTASVDERGCGFATPGVVVDLDLVGRWD
ncbi:MAG TPA: hypothetical protein VI322_05305 [Candidatus Saccharimonadia bacterium]